MVMISSEAQSRIQPVGEVIREIQQRGIPFNVPVGVPIVNPFAEKQLRFKARYKLTGVTLEEVREGIMFANYRGFMDMKMETFSRKARTRHFKINPFTKKMEEKLGGTFGQAGVLTGHAVAASIVAMLGPVEWRMSEDPATSPDLACIHVKAGSWFWGGHFKFRIHRQADGVILDDDWLPEGGGDVRTPTLPMASLVLLTHPLGFEQIAQQVVEEIIQARNAGRPYTGQIGPPSEEID